MNAQTCSMSVSLTGAGFLRGALKPYVPPDLAWCHPPTGSRCSPQAWTAKSIPQETVASAVIQGSKVTWTAWGPGHSTITQHPGVDRGRAPGDSRDMRAEA